MLVRNILGTCFAMVLCIFMSSPTFLFAQIPDDVTEPIVVDEPEGDCFRTTNTSCSDHVELPGDTPTCPTRTCGWVLREYEVVVNGETETITETVPGCIAPPGEPPYEEQVLPLEVPNVANVTTGTGFETFEGVSEADDVDCVGKFKCPCTVENSEDIESCGDAVGPPFETHHPVSGLVVISGEFALICIGDE